MVAYSGPGWKLAPSLVALFEQAKRLFPDRDTSSDGTIGDQSHANRDSDHNPDENGWVKAADVDDDPAHGLDAPKWAEHLRTSRDPRVSYVISEQRIFASYSTSTRRAWEWGPYSGSNPHDSHTHVSVLDTQTGLHDTRPWFPTEDDMTPEQAAQLAEIASDVQVLREHEKDHYDAVRTHLREQDDRLDALEATVDPDADASRKGSGFRTGVRDVVRITLNDDFRLDERLTAIEVALGIVPAADTAAPREG